ncbi:TM2 domain-containing protein [Achromobacter xylosoxidans]
MNSPAMQTMMYDANRKSVGVAYLLWFFLGSAGGHRFYTGRTGSAIAMLALTIVGIALSVIGVGLVLLAAVGIWVIVDAFLIPGWIRNTNMRLAATLSTGNIPCPESRISSAASPRARRACHARNSTRHCRPSRRMLRAAPRPAPRQGCARSPG